MIYTDNGTKVQGSDATPLAFANGVEWATDRRGYKDRFDNLYRFRRAPISSILWMLGALSTLLYIPRWAKGSRKPLKCKPLSEAELRELGCVCHETSIRNCPVHQNQDDDEEGSR